MQQTDRVSSIAPYAIVAGSAGHVGAVAAIELAAARLLAPYAPASVLNETTDSATLLHAVHEQRLWVALSGDVPVGFALVEILRDGRPHLEEIDVHPDHGRRGIGAALVRQVCDWTMRRGFEAITLTTFRAPRWNMPFYRRLGFAPVAAERLTPALAAIVRDEARRGLSADARVVMEYRCPRPIA